jgi:hypothetical protein
MKIVMPLAGLAFLALTAGCTVREYSIERPPDRVEVVPPRPSPAHVWVAGRWERAGDHWDWTRGRWELR